MPAVMAQKGRHPKRVEGFTLIELSIVLVVIGLLIGGVLAGQALIRQSQVNSAMMDAQRYISAAGNFQQKYGSLPGDMANATDYWGTMVTSGLSCPPAAGATSPGGTLTCGGDGNGQVNSLTLSPVTTQNDNEALLFWQHLANAQLIQGSYTGIGGSAGTSDHVIGTNCPASRVEGAGFGIAYVGVVNSSSTIGITNDYYYNANSGTNYGHVLVFGSYKSNNLPVSAILTASEAQSFDNKYDDGSPSSGNVLSWVKTTGYAPSCVTGTTTYTYNTGGKGPLCSLILITGF